MTILKTYTQPITTDGRPFISFNDWLLTLTLPEQQQYETASAARTQLMQQNIIDGNVIESVDENGKWTVSYASTEVMQSIDAAYTPMMGEFWNRYLLENGVIDGHGPALTYTGNDTAPVVEVAPDTAPVVEVAPTV